MNHPPTIYAALCLVLLLAMAIISIALLGNLVDPLPAAAIETTLFAILMWVSGRIKTDL